MMSVATWWFLFNQESQAPPVVIWHGTPLLEMMAIPYLLTAP